MELQRCEGTGVVWAGYQPGGWSPTGLTYLDWSLAGWSEILLAGDWSRVASVSSYWPPFLAIRDLGTRFQNRNNDDGINVEDNDYINVDQNVSVSTMLTKICRTITSGVRQ